MNISVNTVVIITITALILLVLGFFLSSSTSPALQTTDAQSVFNTKCSEYEQYECDWEVTRQEGFGEFLAACREIYGEEREGFSCLYVHCQSCKEVENKPQDMLCYTMCEEARSNKLIGVDNEPTCGKIASECSFCDACSGE